MQNRPQSKKDVLHVRLLGVPDFSWGHRGTVALQERRARALLAYLALHPGVHLSRDRLAALFWPDATDSAARASLRQALSVIRKSLGEEADRVISASRDTVAIQQDAVTTDAGRIMSLSQTQRGLTIEDIPTESTFLEGLRGFSTDFDNWCNTEGERWLVLRLGLLEELADRAEAECRTGEAARLLSGALALDPLNEVFHRRLMSIYATQGRTTEALRMFKRLEVLLSTELDVRPERATLDLVRAIRARRQSRTLSVASGAADADRKAATESAFVAPSLEQSPSHPPTRYAKRGRLNIAYQVSGSGPIDVIWVPGWVSNLDFAWTHPRMAHIFQRLGSFARLIRFDKSGTGLSDRDVGSPTLGDRAEDIRAVMDAVGSERAALIGSSEAGGMSILFAATYPERTSALVLCGSYARGLWAKDYPWRPTVAETEEEIAEVERNWGGPFDLVDGAPSLADDPAEAEWFAGFLRASASPQDATALWRWGASTDVRSILGAIHVPTLILHRIGDRWARIEEGRFLAEHIDGAKLVELPGEDHVLWAGDTEKVLNEIRLFLTTVPRMPPPTRVLATILHMNVLISRPDTASSQHQGEDGIAGKPRNALAEEIRSYGGNTLTEAADLIVAAFESPTAAVRFAIVLVERFGKAGCVSRIGLHTGECERRGNDWTGVAINAAADVARHAEDDEILVSQTVKDLVVGSDFRLSKKKSTILKELPGTWTLHAVYRPSASIRSR